MALFSPGQVVAQRYRLEELIGSGGMSQVWRAHDRVLERSVALKTLGASMRDDPELRAAIRREAKAAAGISHPNVTQVFDFGEVGPADGAQAVIPYLVMELITGESLAHRLATSRPPLAQALRICADVAAALAAAHRQGVVHRDIKPANVMLTAAGAKVVDFGIAALSGPTPGLSDQMPAAPPRHAGTPGYLAPEVLAGAPATAAADVYALGVLMHATLTGAVPPPLALAGVPEDVADLVRRCLAGEPAERPASTEAERWLDRAAHRVSLIGPTTSARPTGVAAVPVGRAGAGTLLDARSARPAGSLAESPGGPAGPAEAAVIAGAPIALVRRRPPASLVLLAVTAILAGLVLVGVAMLAGRAPTVGTAAAPSSQPGSATSSVPTDPQTPAATIDALRSAIAAALTDGQIDEETARRLADDVRALEERLDRGRSRDLDRRVDDVRDRIEEEVADGDLDEEVALRLDSLLRTLLRLSRG